MELKVSRSKGIWVLLLLVSIWSLGFLGLQSARFASAIADAVGLPSMSVTIVGANGTEVVLNETGVSALPSYSGYGGYKNQIGVLKGLGNYTGVPLTMLCSLVGGLTGTSTVKISAADDYSKTFTYAEVNGEFATLDNVTGAETAHSQPLVPVAAYYFNDANVSASSGPLRIAIVGPEGLATNSTYWVKQVVRIEVIDETVPEFPSLMVLPLLFLVTLATLGLKIQRRRQDCLSQSERLAK